MEMTAGNTGQNATLSVIVTIGFPDENLERLDNIRTTLSVLSRQTLGRQRYRLIVVEQGSSRRVREDIVTMVDDYVFAYNAGPFNRSWGRNIGAVRADTPLLCFCDADVVVPKDFLLRGLLAWQCGIRAARPFSEMLYMDAESSHRVRCAVSAEEEIDFHGWSYRGDRHPWNKGGCTWVDARLYLEIGGHDERFVGWGDEDREFWDRLTAVTEIISLSGRVLHLYHEREYHNGPLPRANRLLYRAIQAGVMKKSPGPIGDVDRYRDQAISNATRKASR